MLVFAAFLGCAGAVLSLFARVPVLVAVVFLMVLALVSGAALSVLGVEMSTSLPLTIIVAIVALQTGYGLGVVLRGVLRPFFTDGSEKKRKYSDEVSGSVDPTHNNR